MQHSFVFDTTRNLPAEIKVDGIYYAIKCTKDLRTNSGDKLDGCVTFKICTIQIEKHMNIQSQWQALTHEILHIISTHRGLKLTEEQVDAMAYGLIALCSNV